MQWIKRHNWLDWAQEEEANASAAEEGNKVISPIGQQINE
jgi:hypothetical protein